MKKKTSHSRSFRPSADPDFFGGSNESPDEVQADEPAWLGMLPLGLLPPMPLPDLNKGIMNFPREVVQTLPKPLRDFFKPKTGAPPDTDPDRKNYQKVLTLSDAIRVVEKRLNDAQFVKGIADWLLANVGAAGQGGNPLLDLIKEDMKKAVLQQDKVRVKQSHEYWMRVGSGGES